MFSKWCCFLRKRKVSDASSSSSASASLSSSSGEEYYAFDEEDLMPVISPLRVQRRIPGEYRETPLTTPQGQEINVVALAKLNYSLSTDETCEFLKAQGVETIFGMHIEKNYIESARRHHLNYIALRVRDFSPPGIEIYDQIYNEFIKQAQQGKKIAIHCWGGMGRTGTALVALKLCEMAAITDSFYSNDDSLSCTVRPCDTPCTVNVKIAMDYIRSIRGSEHVIEDPSQVESLVEYERVLKDRALANANACFS